jgi:hypothetical protein
MKLSISLLLKSLEENHSPGKQKTPAIVRSPGRRGESPHNLPPITRRSRARSLSNHAPARSLPTAHMRHARPPSLARSCLQSRAKPPRRLLTTRKICVQSGAGSEGKATWLFLTTRITAVRCDNCRLPREATFRQSDVVEAEAARHPHEATFRQSKRRGSSHVSDRRGQIMGKAEWRRQHGGTVAALLPVVLGPLPVLAALITLP